MFVVAVASALMAWSPPPVPPHRAQALAAAQAAQARRARIRQELMAVKVPMAPEIKFAPALPGQSGAAASDGRTIYFDGRVDDRTMAHEAAHNLEQVMTEADKRRFARVVGRPGKPWDSLQVQGGVTTTRHGSTSERFADMVAMLATRKLPRPGRAGGFGYLDDDPPSLRELRRFSRSLGRFQRRYGLADYVRPTAP
jgi:hypothetical protein